MFDERSADVHVRSEFLRCFDAIYERKYHRRGPSGCTITLPPPALSRIYQQSGVFIRVAQEHINDLHENCSRTIFPSEERLPTEFLKRGEPKKFETRLPADPWFEALRTWCELRVDSFKGDFDDETFRFTFNHSLFMRDYLDGLESIKNFEMYETVYRFIQSIPACKFGQQAFLNSTTMEIIERDSKELMVWLRSSGLPVSIFP
jgi:hypothetical protein